MKLSPPPESTCKSLQPMDSRERWDRFLRPFLRAVPGWRGPLRSRSGVSLRLLRRLHHPSLRGAAFEGLENLGRRFIPDVVSVRRYPPAHASWYGLCRACRIGEKSSGTNGVAAEFYVQASSGRAALRSQTLSSTAMDDFETGTALSLPDLMSLRAGFTPRDRSVGPSISRAGIVVREG